MHTVSVLTGCLSFAWLSDCRAAMAGPDLFAPVFMAEAAALITAHVCPDGVAGCDAPTAVPTVLLSMVISMGLVAVAFACLGRFKLTGIVGYIPANVVCGFLSCIGFKVIKLALQEAAPVFKPVKTYYLKYYFGDWTESWMFILPAIPIGVPLYMLKRYHVGKPTVIFPLFIFVPIAIFYIAGHARHVASPGRFCARRHLPATWHHP